MTDSSSSTDQDPLADQDPSSHPSSQSILSQIRFRTVVPTDVKVCYDIEKASYPADEAASKSSLQYRQHHAAPYFRCAVLGDDDESAVIGFMNATRCQEFRHESMSTHDTSGPLLAIHSVVVAEPYRHQGIATAMVKDYIEAMMAMKDDGVERLVLLAKSNLLGFYVNCGFTVLGVSDVVHGQDTWYDCELRLEKETPPRTYPCWIVDSFAETTTGGSGNPAAVVLMEDGETETKEWMEVVAREFNLAETAFIWPINDEEVDEQQQEDDNHDDQEEEETAPAAGQPKRFTIKYFTCNGTEVDLCGHATLASAAVLFHTLRFKAKKDAAVVFQANKDELKVMPHAEGGIASWKRNGTSIKLKMDFPKKSLIDVTSSADRSAVIAMLKTAFAMEDIAENILYIGLDEDGGDLLIELTTEFFMKLGYDNVNYSALMEWDGYSRGIILCCREETLALDEDDDSITSPSVDFLSRFFGPKAGINEDPVTGSAHCTLAPYFATKLNKTTLVAKQLSRRGGTITCVLEEDRVSIIGTAVTTVSGSLYL